AGRDLPFFRDAQVVAAPSCLEEAPDHSRIPEAKAELEARKPRLRDDELGRADAEAVANSDLVLGRRPLHGQVLAERPPRQRPAELLPPVRVVLGPVQVDGLVGAAVDGQIRLAISLEVEPVDANRAVDGLLEDPGRHLPLPPDDPARKADVDRYHPHAYG